MSMEIGNGSGFTSRIVASTIGGGLAGAGGFAAARHFNYGSHGANTLSAALMIGGVAGLMAGGVAGGTSALTDRVLPKGTSTLVGMGAAGAAGFALSRGKGATGEIAMLAAVAGAVGAGAIGHMFSGGS